MSERTSEWPSALRVNFIVSLPIVQSFSQQSRTDKSNFSIKASQLMPCNACHCHLSNGGTMRRLGLNLGYLIDLNRSIHYNTSILHNSGSIHIRAGSALDLILRSFIASECPIHHNTWRDVIMNCLEMPHLS